MKRNRQGGRTCPSIAEESGDEKQYEHKHSESSSPEFAEAWFDSRSTSDPGIGRPRQVHRNIMRSLNAVHRILHQACSDYTVEDGRNGGCVVERGSGSFSRIEVNTLSCDLPSKAWRPVTIS